MPVNNTTKKLTSLTTDPANGALRVSVVAGGGGGGGDASAANQVETNDRLGATNSAAAASDTATSGINGLLKRVAQRLTTLLGRLPSALGPQTFDASLSVVPHDGKTWAQETYATVSIASVTTSATGATYVALPTVSGTGVDFVNTAPTAVDIEVRRGGSGATIVVPASGSRLFQGVTNANELQVRRLDQSNTQVSVTMEVFVP